MMRIPSGFGTLLSLCGAPAVWAGHFLACYLLVTLACMAGRDELAAPGIAAVTVAALAMLALLAWRSRRTGLRTANEGGALFARVSLALCALSCLALSWVAFPAAVLPACAS